MKYLITGLDIILMLIFFVVLFLILLFGWPSMRVAYTWNNHHHVWCSENFKPKAYCVNVD